MAKTGRISARLIANTAFRRSIKVLRISEPDGKPPDPRFAGVPRALWGDPDRVHPVSSPLPSRLRSAAADDTQSAGESPEGGPERRRHPRIRVDTQGVETVGAAIRAAEREPRAERRTAGNLRNDVGWTVAADRGGNRRRFQYRLKRSRIIVLGIAMVAGGFAAYLANQTGRPSAPAPAAPVSKATVEILVANQTISAGDRLSPASLTWQAWPEQALQSDYITSAAGPGARANMTGMMARSEFLPGDPIRREKLAKGAGGFLSASLDKGMRGVSVAVTAEAASGGFVSPGDRVDVVLTRAPTGGIGGSLPRTETILRDVRVLAIDSKAVAPGTVGPSPDEQQRSNTFNGNAIATLALSSADADLVVSASAIGKLSLLLRSAFDSSHPGATTEAQNSANQAIRLSSPFWLQ